MGLKFVIIMINVVFILSCETFTVWRGGIVSMVFSSEQILSQFCWIFGLCFFVFVFLLFIIYPYNYIQLEYARQKWGCMIDATLC